MPKLRGRCLCLLAALAIAIPVAAQETIADYIKIAEQKTQAKDLDGAVAIYDAILKQLPTELIELYYTRAMLHERQMHFTRALADYDSILKLDSPDPSKAVMNRPRIHAARADTRALLQDFKGAVADYTVALAADPAVSGIKDYDRRKMLKDRAEARTYDGDAKGAIADYYAALAMDPNDSFALSDRASVKRGIRDYDGAIADYSASIAKSEKPSSITYQERGVTRFGKGDFVEALADFQKDVSVGLSTDMEVYKSPILHGSHLLIWILRARLEGKPKADAELAAYLAAARPQKEPDVHFDLANYFMGKAPESQALATAKAFDAKDEDGGQAFQSIALYHIGMKRLIDGDVAGARENLRAVASFEQSMQYMSELAEAELTRLPAPAPAK